MWHKPFTAWPFLGSCGSLRSIATVFPWWGWSTSEGWWGLCPAFRPQYTFRIGHRVIWPCLFLNWNSNCKGPIGSSLLQLSPEELIHGHVTCASALCFGSSVKCMFAVIAVCADYLSSESPAPARAVRSNGCIHTVLCHHHIFWVLGEQNRNGMSYEGDSVVVVLKTS